MKAAGNGRNEHMGRARTNRKESRVMSRPTKLFPGMTAGGV